MSAIPDQKRPRILIVDDDPHIQKFLTDLLVKHNCEPVLASTGQQALEVLEAGNIDLVVTDIRMPGMSGLDLLQQIRTLNPTMPVAVMTGLATVDSAIQAVNHGAYSFVVKPFRARQILRTIRVGLDHREPFRRAAELLPFVRAEVQYVIPSRTKLIQAVSAQVIELANAFGYFLDERRTELRWVVDELVTNAIVHGNKGDDSKKVTIRVTIDRTRMVFEVADEGEGFDITVVPDPCDVKYIGRPGGRGIFLTRKYVDELIYSERGTRVAAIAYAETRGPKLHEQSESGKKDSLCAPAEEDDDE